MNQPQPARRGRPRNFDRDKALERAMQVFWMHGYEGTSMTQLVEAMGIASPSIYAAFGAKEDLFREAVSLYVETEGGAAWRAMTETPDIRLAVRTLLFQSIETFVETVPPRGCLVVLGSSHLEGTDQTIRAFLRDQRWRFRERLLERLMAARESGDLTPENDPGALAECIVAFFSGISIAAADGVSKGALRDTAELFCTGIFGR